MGIVKTADGTEIYYKDWGSGQPVVFCHGWPLQGDTWAPQMLFLTSRGYRTIAHDRRGHGRSSQTSDGNEMDTYSDDLAAVIRELDLRDIVLVGHSTGGGEVARYIGRHGTERVAKAVIIGAVPPFMLQTPDNPEGLPMEVFDGLRAASEADRAQHYRDIADGPFFGNNRPGANVSQGIRDEWWREGMQSGHKNAYECIAAFGQTDFRGDLAKFDVPTLVIHGTEDQVVPFAVGGERSSKLIANAIFKPYQGAPHGLTHTHANEVNADLLAFIEGTLTAPAAGEAREAAGVR